MAHPYQGRYTGRRLWRAADRLAGWLDEGCDVYAYFNNDWFGHAVADAAWLDHRLAAAADRPGQRRSRRAGAGGGPRR